MTDNNKSLHVKGGLKSSHDGRKGTKRRKFVKKRAPFHAKQEAELIYTGSTNALARAITLVESKNVADRKQAQALLQEVMPKTGNSIRIGISGVPGAGKSTFIETFGMMLCEMGYKVAVLAIDPSSSLTGGSVLGDKTRMEKLSMHPRAFIRPSPTSGTLGGVHQKSRETMLLCEAAGYDVVLVETVGVGQSEIAVRNMVDIFLLLVLTGAGDDLQGMKKGIMEMTDLVVVHKADGENKTKARQTMREYRRILHHLQPATPGWAANALRVSSIEKHGHKDVWEQIQSFHEKMTESGFWSERRKNQLQHWFEESLESALIDQFFEQEGKQTQVDTLNKEILE